VATRRLGGAVISCGLQSRRICRWRCRLSLPPLRLPDVWTGPEVDSTTSAGYREKSGTAILYLILSPHRHMATTSDPMRWRGSIAEHVCWRRTPVRWAWCRTGPSRRAPVTTPSPSDTGRVRPCTCDLATAGGATAPALEARRRYEQVRWKRL
jgi:hypothetical protein